MNNKLKKTVASVVITASIMSTGYSVLAAEPAGSEPAAQAVVTYKLTDLLDVEVKGVLNERIQDGTRLGVVIRMKNNSTASTRVPDYELRVKTSEGVEYTLQPSASNVKSIQPKANTELSYMTVIDRTDTVNLAQVNWTDVDYYVYPKKETQIVAAPITGEIWKGGDTPITDPSAIKKWSDSFTIPTLTSPIQYTSAAINKESTEKGTVYVVQLLAYNPSNQRETIPVFTVDGKAAGKVFSGSQVEQGSIALEAKEEKYIHFAIPTDQDTILNSLNILTPEKFAVGGAGSAGAGAGAAAGAGAGANAGAAAGAAGVYNVGRLNILLPSQQTGETALSYKLGTPMTLDKRSQLIHPDMDVSVIEFHMFDNKEEGSKTVSAKFKLTNKTDRPLAVPAFATDLVSSDGYEYNGSRQNITMPNVLPNSSLTVNYFYTIPVSETGKGLSLKIQDTKTAAPYKSTIGAYGIALQTEDSKDTFELYPFEIRVNNWQIGTSFNPMGLKNYQYKAKFWLEVSRHDQVQVDPSFSGLLFELYNSSNQLIGTGSGAFTGVNRLSTGENNIIFDGSTEQFDHPLTVRIYEQFTTTGGQKSKRLLKELKQS
ncbi:hypothetical protein [Paenibacillus tyrfis]|uniref:DUF4352 domain-containing protein n=1 Tax=Paenibacillus tyrfis TaxID=1501230 RepID=A0A081P9B9_9BACL|nr:hypothetical protein [Paenibacillus tyrfis]KEQ27292.1 hypothetical protein ET33_25805 [Paenibacillus tyrfis]